MAEPVDEEQEKALLRYTIISAYLAMEPTRGQKGPLLEKLASKTWVGRNGEPYAVSAETIRSWLRRYGRKGLDGLRDKPRPRRGVVSLSPETVDIVIKLKREVPERSLDRIIVILESMNFCEKGMVRRSTLHRVLKREGISARPTRPADDKDLDRWEADLANDLWQSDLLDGPWLPDPEQPGRVRRARLYAFLDDHSRLLLHGRFSFKGELPHLELVFRRSVQKWGVPRGVYYDNGQVYRSGQMRQVVATLGIHRIVFTQKRRPMGHGKIEALNRFITSNFIAEVKSSKIKTLDELNEAFVAFADVDYNQAVHGETNEAPLQRWKKDVERVRYVDEKLVLQAFLWREHRTPDKTGLFSLFGVRYQTGASMAKKRIEVRYDPERLSELDVYFDGRFVERVRPFTVSTHRRPHTLPPSPPPAPPGPPTADWLTHLIEQRKNMAFIEEAPRVLSQEIARARALQDAAIVSLLEEHVDGDVLDERAIVDFLARYGPFDEDKARHALESLGDDAPRDLHITHYLDAIRRNHGDRP